MNLKYCHVFCLLILASFVVAGCNSEDRISIDGNVLYEYSFSVRCSEVCPYMDNARTLGTSLGFDVVHDVENEQLMSQVRQRVVHIDYFVTSSPSGRSLAAVLTNVRKKNEVVVQFYSGSTPDHVLEDFHSKLVDLAESHDH